jgi:MoaA/NifB/PqqE/SkfB family radical SAM enzyme
MKAKFETRSPVEDRIDLADVVPLSAPLTVVAEVTSVCNLRCHFCPTGDIKLTKETGKFRGLMDFALFQKLIADIDTLPTPVKALHLHKDGEPLTHPKFCDMVLAARRSANIEKIETTTNGVLLNPELNRRLVDTGIDRIKISVYGLSTGGFKENTKASVDFDRYVANIADLYGRRKNTKLYIKIMEEGLSEAEKETFLTTFGNIADVVFFEHCVDTWPDFSFDEGGNLVASDVGVMGQSVRPYKKVCPQPFFNFTVCADGRVTACCADWQVKLVVGDIRQSSLTDIWHGKEFNDLRLMMLRGERACHSLCGQCGYPTVACIDDIDDAAPTLLERFQQYAMAD